MTMKRSFYALAALAVGACLAAAAAPLETISKLSRAVKLGMDALSGWLFSLVRGSAALAQPKAGEVVQRPLVLLVVARAFVAQLSRRERPRVTPGWRMCPST